MELPSSNFKTKVTCATLFIIIIVAESELSPMESEREALLNSGWWSNTIANDSSKSDRCKWDGVICNTKGSITQIYIINKKISGELSRLNFSFFPNLESLNLGHNSLTGPIPSEIGSLRKMKELSLAANKLDGSIPSTIGNLNNLKRLYLYQNNLSGQLPDEICNGKNLMEFDAGHNNLTGHIPSTLFLLTNLTYVNLQFNRLSGQIPMTIGGLSKLEYLDLSNNKLSGSVPSEIGNCFRLLTVTLSNNSLNGTIPLEMGKMIFLEYLDLSYNNISGTVPEFIHRIRHTDLAHNNLEEETPTTFEYASPAPAHAPVTVRGADDYFPDSYLPFAAPPQEKSNKVMNRLITIGFPIAAFVAFFVLGTLFLLRRKNKRAEITSREIKSRDRDVFSIWNYDGRIAFEEIIRATEDFDIKYCIGTGVYSSVYKAQLRSGRIFALKKLHR